MPFSDALFAGMGGVFRVIHDTRTEVMPPYNDLEETSVTSQERRQLESYLPTLSLNPRPYLPVKHRNPLSSRLVGPSSRQCEKSLPGIYYRFQLS